ERINKADKEPLLPGLAYIGAAAIGSSVLVNRSFRTMPVRILTPLAVAAVTGAYFLPAHTELLKNPRQNSRALSDDVPLAPPALTTTTSTLSSLTTSSPTSTTSSSSYMQEVEPTEVEIGPKMMPDKVDTSPQDKKKAEVGPDLNEDSKLQTTTVPEKPSSSRWSWWTQSDYVTPNTQTHEFETSGISQQQRVRRPSSDSASKSIPIPGAMSSAEAVKEHMKPQKVLIDKAVASAAIKGHDKLLNREAQYRANVEETARKVHDNVIDATLPKHHQHGRHESYKMEVTRQASESDLRDGQFIVKNDHPEDPNALPRRVRRGSIKKDQSHGLENLDKRLSMMHQGVEHVEHSINKKIEKELQREADFWHQQS
ncbi:hypothetical protein BGZ98_005740, partial [Dissophora globulifera]